MTGLAVQRVALANVFPATVTITTLPSGMTCAQKGKRHHNPIHRADKHTASMCHHERQPH